MRKPTRGNNILDLVLSSEDDLVDELSVGEEVGGSDHRLVRFLLRVPRVETARLVSRKLDLRRADFAGLCAGLADVSLEEGENAEDLWNSFKTTFMELQSRFIPLKNSRRASVQPRWFS